MRSLKTLLISAALLVAASVAAQAVTLINFSLTETTQWEVESGRILTLTGGYTGDMSGLDGADPETPISTLVDVAFDLDGNRIFDGSLGQVDFRPRDAVFNILGIALDLDQATPGVTPYLEGGLNRAASSTPLDLGGGNSLFFTYTNAPTGPNSEGGTFTLVLDQVAPLTDGILAGVINHGIFELELLDSLRTGAVTGSIGGEIVVSAVPHPAGFVLLMGAMMGLAVLRRRQRAQAL